MNNMSYVMPIDQTARKVMCIASIETYKTSRVTIHKLIWVNQSLSYVALNNDKEIIKELEEDYYRIEDIYTDEKIIKTLFMDNGLIW